MDIALAGRLSPMRIREMLVVTKPGHNVPVHMRRFIAQTGQVDFIWLYHFPHCGFHRKHRFHHPRALRGRQIAHFLDVRNQFDAAISRVIRVIQQHHAAKTILPQNLVGCWLAEWAGCIQISQIKKPPACGLASISPILHRVQAL